MRRYKPAWLLLALLAAALLVFILVSTPNSTGRSNSVAPAPLATPADQRLSQQLHHLTEAIFTKIDRDDKGYITLEDIDQAILVDHSIKGDNAVALYTLKQFFDQLSTNSAKGVRRITLENLKDIQTNHSEALALSIDALMGNSSSFLKTVNRELYPSGTPEESLQKMRIIHQYRRGNCYFQSGLVSLAAIDPQSAREMIQDNGLNAEGIRTYTIRFLRKPKEDYVLEELTDASYLVNDVEADTGTWITLLIRAYGMYQFDHPVIRFPQRLLHGLNSKVLPEDLTDEGSMFNDGLQMGSRDGTSVQRVIWAVDTEALREQLADGMVRLRDAAVKQLSDTNWGMMNDSVGPKIRELRTYLKDLDEAYLRAKVAKQVAEYVNDVMKSLVYSPRDPAVVHKQLKGSICDNKLPATVFKHGGRHEASILDYRPGTVAADGKHTSQYGFVTVRDQIGLAGDELSKINQGIWWREPGMDNDTACMSVEEFTAFYVGFASVVKDK